MDNFDCSRFCPIFEEYIIISGFIKPSSESLKLSFEHEYAGFLHFGHFELLKWIFTPS